MSSLIDLSENVNSLRYKEKVVAFVDVLGFSDLVTSGDESALKACITELLSPVQEVSDDISCYVFSDCCYMCTDIDNAKELLKVLLILQGKIIYASPLLIKAANAEFTYNRILLIRGGITVGNIIESSELNICVGPAAVEAYNLESKCAEMPRIIVSEKALERCFNESDMAKYILTDKKGYSFTDFKKYWLDVNDMDFSEYDKAIDSIAKEMEDKGNLRVSAKYIWLKEYLYKQSS